MKSELLTKKLDELIELAKAENEPNTLVVLLALRGARKANDDELLANSVQTLLRDVLLPKAQEKRKADLN